MHLWEAEHSYYCRLECWNERDSSIHWPTWPEFFAEFGDSDPDYNLLFRWDWKGLESAPYNPQAQPDDHCRDGEFYAFWMGQRKGMFFTSVVSVCRTDEPAVIEFLKPRFAHLQKMWSPIKSE